MDLNIKVLIVDDFAVMRRTVRRTLRMIGFTEIDEAKNGKEALKKLREGKFDLVLSDWSMPEMSGPKLLGSMKADKDLRDIPFIMISAESSKEGIAGILKAGANGYITKPFTQEMIEQKISDVLR